jgi:hypothetical protein
MMEYLETRFTTTADGAQMQAAYVLTPPGHSEFHLFYDEVSLRLTGEQGTAVAAFANSLPRVVEAVANLAVYFFPGADPSAVATLVYSYLGNGRSWSLRDGFVREWARMRSAASPGSLEYDFASTAVVLTQVPATVAAAERLISVFECLFRKNHMTAQLDLIQREMLIRMSQIHHPDDIEGLVDD